MRSGKFCLMVRNAPRRFQVRVHWHLLVSYHYLSRLYLEPFLFGDINKWEAVNRALLAGVFVAGIGIGITLDSAINTNPKVYHDVDSTICCYLLISLHMM